MRFNITKKIYIEAETYETRYSWGHKAWLYVKGHEVDYKKITYYNRTWECYEFETILNSLVSDTKELRPRQKSIAKKLIKNEFRVEDKKRVDKMFSGVAMVAAMGDILTSGIEESNTFKKKILKAGLPGLDIPSDWDNLSEEVKNERLNGVIDIINN